MTRQTGEDLTTSRITRLLRPLRAKCHKLASYFPEELSQSSRGATTVTYGTSSRQSNADPASRQEPPPLDVIPPPEKLVTLSKLDRPSRENLELSRRIYDVRDSFRNLLQAVLSPTSPSRRSSMSTHPKVSTVRIRSLAAVCAATVGDHIEGQVQLAAEENGDAAAEEDEDLKIIDSLYEAVYPQYRKYTIISHALSVILSACSLQHTLLSVLLDVTLSHNLVPESRLLLRHMFAYALQPTNHGATMPILHHAHSRYLTQLLDTCRRPQQGATLSERVFMAVLSEAISDAPPVLMAQFWTSRATINLARTLRSEDYAAFLSLCTSVGLFLSSHSELSSRRQGKSPEAVDALNDVATRLGKWLSHVCQRFYDLDRMDTENPEEILVIADILINANASGFHRSHWSADAEVLVNAIACLSAMCIASRTVAALSPASLESCHSILRKVKPKPDTFAILVAVATPQMSKFTEHHHLVSLNATISTAIPVFQRWARTLRDHSYHLLESSLWSSALNYIEGLTPEIGTHYNPESHHNTLVSELERLRYEMVKRVEDAERRCFNTSEKTDAFSTQTPRKASLSNDEWRWEDLVGCWVQKTPICTAQAIGTKRRRSAIEHAPVAAKHPRQEASTTRPAPRSETSEKRRPLSRANSVSSTTDSTSATIKIPCQSTSQSHLSKYSLLPNTPETTHFSKCDQENRFSSRSMIPKPMQSRRVSNFASILRDAFANRVVLHTDALEGVRLDNLRGASKRPFPAGHSSLSEDEDEADLGTSLGGFSADHPSSDDALDLFAYRSSEW